MTDERSYDVKTTVLFRFLSLDPAQAKELLAAFPGCRIGKHHKTGEAVGCVRLDSVDTIPAIVAFMTKHAVPEKQCDVFLSVFTESDTELWDVPRVVNRLLQSVDCQMVFSFTAMG